MKYYYYVSEKDDFKSVGICVFSNKADVISNAMLKGEIVTFLAELTKDEYNKLTKFK